MFTEVLPLTETSWQSKKESCKFDSATGLYYFDTSKIGTIEDGADYALLSQLKTQTETLTRQATLHSVKNVSVIQSM